MQQESLRKATELIINAIQNSDIDELDKTELMFNLYIFLTHYHEAINQRFTNNKYDETTIKRKK